MTGQQKFSDLKVRSITAAVLISILICFEMLHRGFPQLSLLFPVIALLLVCRCAYEFVALSENASLRQKLLYGSSTALPGLATFLIGMTRDVRLLEGLAPTVLGLGICGLLIALLAVSLSGRRSLESAACAAHELLVGTVLIGLGGASLVSLALVGDHSLLYWMLLVVIANDTGAYFIGKKFGATKLSAFVSPGKSVEGMIGGLVCGILLGLALGQLTPMSSWSHVAGTGFFVGIVGQLFDLGKSFLKRLADVKDSGSILPGHGGILDRLDGMLGGALALHLFAVITI